MTFQKKYAQLVYCAAIKENISPPFWAIATASQFSLYELLDSLGGVDFIFLDDDTIVAWLKKNGQWVKDNTASENPDDWNLSDDDLTKIQDRETQDRIHDEKLRSSIELDGELVSARKEDFNLLAESIAKGLNEGFLNIPNQTLKLSEISETEKHLFSHNVNNKGSGKKKKETSHIKLMATGFIGECLAYHWLKNKYPENFHDECWKSRMRDYKFGGTSGEDSLGYDFEIKLEQRIRYFEVKATTGDTAEIELGETEIRTAQKFSADRDHIFRILFITNVNDSEKRRIHLLPNPFSREGKGCYRPVGTGIRFQFNLD